MSKLKQISTITAVIIFTVVGLHAGAPSANAQDRGTGDDYSYSYASDGRSVSVAVASSRRNKRVKNKSYNSRRKSDYSNNRGYNKRSKSNSYSRRGRNSDDDSYSRRGRNSFAKRGREMVRNVRERVRRRVSTRRPNNNRSERGARTANYARSY